MTKDLRASILSVAKTLLIQQGYRGLSMREIAEAVGVSKAALYYHFKDKEELLLAILDLYLDDMDEMLTGLIEQPLSTRQKIYLLVEQILAQPAENRSVMRLSSQEMAQLSAPARQAFDQSYHCKFLDKVQAILESGIQRGELRPVDPSVATWALLGMMYPYFYPAHSVELPPASEIAGQIAGLFLDGMGAKE